MIPDIFERRKKSFVLWRPAKITNPPSLIIGTLVPGNPSTFKELGWFEMSQVAGHPDLWECKAADCGLQNGKVYHYWFEITDANPYIGQDGTLLVTDPLASCVDWRLLPPLPSPYGKNDRDPAAVIGYEDGELVVRDPGGERITLGTDTYVSELPPNNRLVVYELPTAWSRNEGLEAEVEIGVGTFRDVAALIGRDEKPANFSGLSLLEVGRSHIEELGVNALELLPIADSFVDREWGYATSNYFAPDYDLGYPRYHLSPTANSDLSQLINLCHQQGIRFVIDVVMAFATNYSYQNINYHDFHVQAGLNDPEEFDQHRKRDGFGGDLFRYNTFINSYDPLTGERNTLSPSRQLMLAHISRWINDFHVDGIRIDSVENIGSWDFVRDFSHYARYTWQSRWQSDDGQHIDSRFLVVGEELAVPVELVRQHRLDGLWNENFKRMVRCALLGEVDEKSADFETMIRRMIDCRLLGFADGAQAVNYVTSHDVEGYRNERLYDFCNNNGISDTEPRIKLAFVCLLTAVGIPMIFAGEEFADEHDLAVKHPFKQVDPVNYDRCQEEWRNRIFDYVRCLVKFRTTVDALSVNDTEFIHSDFNDGKRVVAWKRGGEMCGNPVVVVANFSDYQTPDPQSPHAEYVVPNWPPTMPGKQWREVSRNRPIAPEWVGREPIFPWEAKVYVLE